MRVDKVRVRRVYYVEVRWIDDKYFELRFIIDGGFYIKEFIFGDKGRMKLSVSDFFGKLVWCEWFDVLNVFDEERFEDFF